MTGELYDQDPPDDRLWTGGEVLLVFIIGMAMGSFIAAAILLGAL